MILNCPLCQTRYLVPSSLFANGSRKVRCARCLHLWEASPPNDIDVVLIDPPLPMTKPSEPTPIPIGSNLPTPQVRHLSPRAHVLLAGLGIFFGVVAILILYRQNIVGHWPRLESSYHMMGLHIEHTGDGIRIEDVHYELVYENGMKQLIVEGQLHNITEDNQLIPNILASAIAPDGRAVQSWQIDAPVDKLAPKETAHFRSSLKAPEESILKINLDFVEWKNDNQ